MISNFKHLVQAHGDYQFLGRKYFHFAKWNILDHKYHQKNIDSKEHENINNLTFVNRLYLFQKIYISLNNPLNVETIVEGPITNDALIKKV